MKINISDFLAHDERDREIILWELARDPRVTRENWCELLFEHTEQLDYDQLDDFDDDYNEEEEERLLGIALGPRYIGEEGYDLGPEDLDEELFP
jgi:hypothetical protein